MIYLIRHGFSQGNADFENYIKIGDEKLGLDDRGWQQAITAGAFLAPYLAQQGLENWPRIWTSSLQRTIETTSGLLSGMGSVFKGQPELHEDPRLVEMSFGVLSHLIKKSQDPVDGLPYKNILALSEEFYRLNPFTSMPPFGESPLSTLGRVDNVIATLCRDIENGTKPHIIVTHGATIKAFLMRWFHLPMSAWKELKTPNNCDIFCIKPGENGNLRHIVTQIFDGENGLAVHTNPIAHIKHLTVSALPAVPAHLKRNL